MAGKEGQPYQYPGVTVAQVEAGLNTSDLSSKDGIIGRAGKIIELAFLSGALSAAVTYPFPRGVKELAAEALIEKIRQFNK